MHARHFTRRSIRAAFEIRTGSDLLKTAPVFNFFEHKVPELRYQCEGIANPITKKEAIAAAKHDVFKVQNYRFGRGVN